MYGDHASTGHIIEVFKQRGSSVVHKQVEKRGDRLYMRIQKRSVTSMLDL